MKHLLINLTFLIYPEYLLKYFCTKKPAHFRTGLLHLCIFLINNDRISAVNRIIDQCCLICRKVDTAMTSGATFISVSSERRLPGCIMKPLPIYKWHPVIYFYVVSIFLTAQVIWTCLVGNRPCSSVCLPAGFWCSTDDICFCHKCSIFVQPQMLVIRLTSI